MTAPSCLLYTAVVPSRLLVVMLLAAACLAGCDGGNGDGDAPAWPGPPEPAEDGSVSVEEFAAHQADVDERWERAAETAAAEFLRLDERSALRTTIEGSSEGEGEGPRAVAVTLDGLLDDSIRAERWELRFEQDGEGYRLTSATRTLSCQPGRGHGEFEATPCA